MGLTFENLPVIVEKERKRIEKGRKQTEKGREVRMENIKRAKEALKEKELKKKREKEKGKEKEIRTKKIRQGTINVNVKVA